MSDVFRGDAAWVASAGRWQPSVPKTRRPSAGMSGARLLLTAAHELQKSSKRYALCTMCVCMGQGIATLIERD